MKFPEQVYPQMKKQSVKDMKPGCYVNNKLIENEAKKLCLSLSKAEPVSIIIRSVISQTGADKDMLWSSSLDYS